MNITYTDSVAVDVCAFDATRAALAALWVALALAVSGCGAVGAALSEGNTASGAPATLGYSQEMYLSYAEPQYVGEMVDTSGSLSLGDGDLTWAQSGQELTAAAIAERVPPLPETEAAFAGGVAGVPELRFIYLPGTANPGEWRGSGTPVEVTVPGVPTLAPQPQPELEDDVTGPRGKGAAWSAAKASYRAAWETASATARQVSQQIATIPLERQNSDVYSSVAYLASQLGGSGRPDGDQPTSQTTGIGTILVLSDLKGVQNGSDVPELGRFAVVAVQGCTGQLSDCETAKLDFTDFVTRNGAQAPVVTGHESIRQVLFQTLTGGTTGTAGAPGP
jgi:hypothetical protein